MQDIDIFKKHAAEHLLTLERPQRKGVVSFSLWLYRFLALSSLACYLSF